MDSEPLTREQIEHFMSEHFIDMRALEFRHAVWSSDQPGWDHDHCTFCWREISSDDCDESTPVGYVDVQGNAWVCERCFAALRPHYKWNLRP